jgi:CRISPR/Cas system CSM-associated protein Csm3 (group 7 of RAMP superfamily)
MARTIYTRLILEGTLLARAPLHIGGAEEGTEVDMPVALDGQGQPYAPGTSLTGAIRAWMETAFDPWLVRCWFGCQDAGTDAGAASRLVVDDAPITLPGGAPMEVWHGVGIDRPWGTAATEFKFERQVLPKGSILPLRLHVDVGDEEGLGDARAALWYLGHALEEGCIGLGAANTRGLGRVALNPGWQACSTPRVGVAWCAGQTAEPRCPMSPWTSIRSTRPASSTIPSSCAGCATRNPTAWDRPLA